MRWISWKSEGVRILWEYSWAVGGRLTTSCFSPPTDGSHYCWWRSNRRRHHPSPQYSILSNFCFWKSQCGIISVSRLVDWCNVQYGVCVHRKTLHQILLPHINLCIIWTWQNCTNKYIFLHFPFSFTFWLRHELSTLRIVLGKLCHQERTSLTILCSKFACFFFWRVLFAHKR